MLMIFVPLANFLLFNLHQKPFDFFLHCWLPITKIYSTHYLPFQIPKISAEWKTSNEPLATASHRHICIILLFFAHHRKGHCSYKCALKRTSHQFSVYAICNDNLCAMASLNRIPYNRFNAIYYFRKCSSFSLTSHTLLLFVGLGDTIFLSFSLVDHFVCPQIP